MWRSRWSLFILLSPKVEPTGARRDSHTSSAQGAPPVKLLLPLPYFFRNSCRACARSPPAQRPGACPTSRGGPCDPERRRSDQLSSETTGTGGGADLGGDGAGLGAGELGVERELAGVGPDLLRGGGPHLDAAHLAAFSAGPAPSAPLDKLGWAGASEQEWRYAMAVAEWWRRGIVRFARSAPPRLPHPGSVFVTGPHHPCSPGCRILDGEARYDIRWGGRPPSYPGACSGAVVRTWGGGRER